MIVADFRIIKKLLKWVFPSWIPSKDLKKVSKKLEKDNLFKNKKPHSQRLLDF